MEENKNIDRLFQERLKNLDSKPSEKVWTGIEAKLKKEEKRILPIWWFSGGIAATLILGFLLFPFSTDENTDQYNFQNIEIITTSPKNKIEKNSEKKTNFNFPADENKTKEVLIVTTEKPILQKRKSTENSTVLIAKNSNLSEEKQLENFTEKESNPDSKVATKKVFRSEKKQDITIEKAKPEKELFLKPKKDFLATLEQKDSLIKEQNSIKKWSVAPSFAVLNSNSFSSNSSLGESLNSNSTTGENTYSYGVKVAYQINNRWTFQSGIHLQEMGFTTKDIGVSASFSKQNLTNVKSSIQLEFNATNTAQFSDVSTSKLANYNEKGELNQRFGYIEIPLEIKYNLSNSSKFKTEIVTGFSSLFLNKNSINLASESYSGNMGEATNLNSFNFSGNLGFDFNYAVDKNLFLNLNPMFKAQLNTFSKNSNGFQPYFSGFTQVSNINFNKQ